ncbi:hypothetical protein [Sulfurospirillum arcachonense]|uniref:hypothetical protein n=1 Tax=Sulfurospirillum arcachonense TaxID=57666 RepID=UPI000469614C|nr:hypothetical protein [Sulfurospirillum arcachonense]
MALKKVFQKYFSNLFISIVQENNEWIIYSKILKNGVIKDKFSESFIISEDGSIPPKMEKYLEEFHAKYNFIYVSVFLDSMGQGAISGTSANDFEKNSIDMKNVVHFDIDKKWSVYASFIDINWVKKLFQSTGIDFIYSPFVIQNVLIKKQKSITQPILYILNHKDSVTISIFENEELTFGAYFKTTTDDNLSSGEEDWDNVDEEEGVDNLIELDTIEDDELGSVDELENLDELDSLDDVEDNDFEDIDSERDHNLGHFEGDEESIEEESNLELFGRDILLYKYLNTSLQEFYKNPLYKSNFIEKVVIFDGYEISSELIEMIEDELLMDIEMNKININEVVCDMSIKEALQ